MTPKPNIGYNNKGEVVNVDHSNNAFDKSYDFDGIGNRKTSEENGVETNYTVNKLNQYTAVGVAAQSYDEDGNTLTKRLPADVGNDATPEWNGNNRLTKVTFASGKEVSMEYDHMGRRYRKVVEEGGVASYTYWIYDGYNAIAKYTRSAGGSEASLAKTYYWGKDLGGGEGTGGLLAESQITNNGQQITEGSFFPLFDGNGNITDYVDSTAAVVAHYQYDSFGKVLASSGAKKDEMDYGFSTRVNDRDLGLSYYNYRYYDSVDGRWLSRDPIEESGGLNLYGFVGNSPITGWDSLGWQEEGDKKISITEFNDIEVNIVYLGLLHGGGSGYNDLNEGRDGFRLMSWETKDIYRKDFWGTPNSYFLKPDQESIEVHTAPDGVIKSVKKLLSGKKLKAPVMEVFEKMQQLRFNVLNHGLKMYVEYEFQYKTAVCKEEWIGEDLYWSWSAFASFDQKKVTQISYLDEGLVGINELEWLRGRVKKLFDVKDNIALKMLKEAEAVARAKEGV